MTSERVGQSDQEKFYKAMAAYYKNERERTEKAFGYIIDIAGDETADDHGKLGRILTVLVEHYSR